MQNIFDCTSNIILKDVQSILDLIGKIYPNKKIIISQNNLVPEFFDLSSGLAGEILQKISNYNLTVAFIVDLNSIKSEKFKEMVNEANFRSDFRFFDSKIEAEKWLDSLDY